MSKYLYIDLIFLSNQQILSNLLQARQSFRKPDFQRFLLKNIERFYIIKPVNKYKKYKYNNEFLIYICNKIFQ